MTPFLHYHEQLDLLLSRGLIVHDRDAAIRDLADLNYYHLSGYSLDFLDHSRARFIPGTTFENIVNRCETDREMRILLLRHIAPVEQRVRTAVGHTLGQLYGPCGYYKSSNFRNANHHANFIHTLRKEKRRSKELFVRHHGNHDQGQLPPWVMVQLLPLGSLSKVARNMLPEAQQLVAQQLGVHQRILFSQLRAITVVRNMCARHARLFGNHIHAHCDIAKDDLAEMRDIDPHVTLTTDSLFAVVLAILGLQPHYARVFFTSDLSSFALANPRYRLAALGFPEAWQDLMHGITNTTPPAGPPELSYEQTLTPEERAELQHTIEQTERHLEALHAGDIPYPTMTLVPPLAAIRREVAVTDAVTARADARLAEAVAAARAAGQPWHNIARVLGVNPKKAERLYGPGN